MTATLSPSARILIIRLDRLGDVVLSMPVAQALREARPSAFLAMLVKPECRELIDGHPALNQALVYDKAGAHRGVLSTIRFAMSLRRERFDIALVLHPTFRAHWIAWLAGIPRRIGYARKGGWLLTQRLPHEKQRGRRHEADYTLDFVRALGVVPSRASPAIAVSHDAVERVNQRLGEHGIDPQARLVAIHPSASSVSKRWMPERFAAVADRLAQEQATRIVLVAGRADEPCVEQVTAAMRRPVVNLAGRLSVGELAALLRRAQLLISNDSGPVHIAAAVGTPVVAIFGRNQPGLSQGRWRPLGNHHTILQKDVGCTVCLADRCVIAFRCLTELPVDEVYNAAVRALRNRA